jgi:hypothetical protein
MAHFSPLLAGRYMPLANAVSFLYTAVIYSWAVIISPEDVAHLATWKEENYFLLNLSALMNSLPSWLREASTLYHFSLSWKGEQHTHGI